jgi:hypothetical protein
MKSDEELRKLISELKSNILDNWLSTWYPQLFNRKTDLYTTKNEKEMLKFHYPHNLSTYSQALLLLLLNNYLK